MQRLQRGRRGAVIVGLRDRTDQRATAHSGREHGGRARAIDAADGAQSVAGLQQIAPESQLLDTLIGEFHRPLVVVGKIGPSAR